VRQRLQATINSEKVNKLGVFVLYAFLIATISWS